MTKISKKKAVLEELGKNLGLRSVTCKNMGISRDCFYRWMQEDEVFRAGVKDVDENVIDKVESHLYKLISDGNPTSIIFFLKTRGKSRGYIESSENIISGGSNPQNIKFTFETVPPEEKLKMVRDWLKADDEKPVEVVKPVPVKDKKTETIEYGYEEPPMKPDELPALESKPKEAVLEEVTDEPEG